MFFKKELKSQQAEEGDDITLSVEVSKPGVAVEWRKGGSVLQPCMKYEMRQEGCVCELCIRSLEAEDSGYYTCDAGDQLTTASLAVQGIRAGDQCLCISHSLNSLLSCHGCNCQDSGCHGVC